VESITLNEKRAREDSCGEPLLATYLLSEGHRFQPPSHVAFAFFIRSTDEGAVETKKRKKPLWEREAETEDTSRAGDAGNS